VELLAGALPAPDVPEALPPADERTAEAHRPVEHPHRDLAHAGQLAGAAGQHQAGVGLDGRAGGLQAVAEQLHVHPQTVRYRLARLRELFGTRLDDPDGRFELELALRARKVAG